MTVLTDDEMIAAVGAPAYLTGGRTVEAAVLAKLAQQTPVATLHVEGGLMSIATKLLPDGKYDFYTHPAPQQADRQRVPDGWKLVPVEPTEKMCNPNDEDDAAAKMAARYRREIWSQMLAAAPEAPAQADACCGNWAAGTSCFADPKINCPRLLPATEASAQENVK